MDVGTYMPESRKNVRQWQNLGPSSIACCTSLGNSTVLKQANSNLMHPSVPTLCLLDSLAERGWVGTPRSAIPACDNGVVAEYDSRRPLSNKRYLQCLHILPQLFDAGLAFTSGKPSTYYAFILRSRKLPDGDKPMAELKKLIEDADDSGKDGFSLPILPITAALAPIADEDEIAIELEIPSELILDSDGVVEDQPSPSGIRVPAAAAASPGHDHVNVANSDSEIAPSDGNDGNGDHDSGGERIEP